MLLPGVFQDGVMCALHSGQYCVMQPFVCRQHVWEQPSKAGAVVDGPVLGALKLVMLVT